MKHFLVLLYLTGIVNGTIEFGLHLFRRLDTSSSFAIHHKGSHTLSGLPYIDSTTLNPFQSFAVRLAIFDVDQSSF